MAYTRNIGIKFDEVGNPLKYLGNTIICFTNDEDSEIFKALVYAQEEFKKLSFANKYAFLPPSSFHMTAITLTREIDRGTKFWPSWIDKDMGIKEIDAIYKKIVDSMEKPKGFKMKINGFHDDGHGITLSPYDEKNRQLIRGFRDMVSEKFGIKFDTHDNFVFHVTISYRLQDLTGEEKDELKQVVEEAKARLLSKVDYIITDEPRFTIFNDMLAYYEDISKRI